MKQSDSRELLSRASCMTFEPLSAIPWLAHGFSTRAMGDLGTSRERFLQHGIPARLTCTLDSLGMNASKATLAQQVHQDHVVVVRVADPAPSMREGTDALITRDVGLPLITYGADCPNVFFVDTGKKAIGLAHSGRLGTLARIAPKTIAAMQQEFGTQPGNLLVVISPSIGKCCYPTDLWGMLETQLQESGVSRVFNPRVCTYCNAEIFYSYRKSKDSCGRMMAALMLR